MRIREEEHMKETAALKQQCEDAGNTWMNLEDISWMSDADHDQGVHGYCVSLTPQLMKRMTDVDETN